MMKRSVTALFSLMIALATFGVTMNLANVVCFVRFSDTTDSEATFDTANYETLFNNEADGANSVLAYFHDMSYGTLRWHSEIVQAVYTDTYPRAYYEPKSATNTQGYSTTLEANERIAEMMTRIAPHVEANLPAGTVIDGNGDGYIDNMVLVFAGNSARHADQKLWPNNAVTTLSTINGKKTRNYVMVFNGLNGLHAINTGVLCHEMMHTFDVPDFYYTGSTRDLDPVNKWDLMSDNGTTPQAMTAYTRRTYGIKYGTWISRKKFTELENGGTYTLRPLNSATPDNVCYKIAPAYSTGEYFVVEYRRKAGWDSQLPGEGLLVYRINPNGNGNKFNNLLELYVFRPGAVPDADGSLTVVGEPAKAAMSASNGRTSFGAVGDALYPFYNDGTRAQFSITDIGEPTEDGITFTLTFGDFSGIAAVGQDVAAEVRYDAATGEVVAPEGSEVTVYALDGRQLPTVKDAPAGVYVARVVTPAGELRTLKFVKK